MDTLVDSSPESLDWLSIIKSKIEGKNPSLIYKEGKYWASFKSSETKRNIVHLHPQKGQIRLFTILAPSFDNSLKQTPCTGTWAKNFPSMFKIKSVTLINKACDLIISSYKEDLSK
jgi:hypothetical protein